ncbi:hypothetical protein, partial [Erwinia amylovora]|uniref:hypothetical protein n=1 Tax=Erwinia amylovora TaxID=552 RepID=UPI0020C138E1
MPGIIICPQTGYNNNDFLALRANQTHRSASKRFRANGAVAHHQYRLAQRRTNHLKAALNTKNQ